MADYRCYFLGPIRTMFGVPSSIVEAEDFLADIDEQALLKAEAMYGQRQSHIHGFEVWQGTRLVHQHVAKKQNEINPQDQVLALP